MDLDVDSLIEYAGVICQDIRFPLGAAILEFVYELENYRINFLRPDEKRISEWEGTPDGLARFAKFVERRIGRTPSFTMVCKLWDIYSRERYQRGRVSNRRSLILSSMANTGTLVCEHCRRKIEEHEAEIDHYIPVARGGDSSDDNLRILCKRCNRRKGDKYWILLES